MADGSVGPGEVPKQAKEQLKIAQIMGSSAGSGSGDFHTYRNARNLERDRIAKMDRDAREEEARNKFERDRAVTNFHLEQATKKKAEKRKRKKEAKEASEKKAKREAGNVIPNDGSFLEQFLKEQAAQAKGDVQPMADDAPSKAASATSADAPPQASAAATESVPTAAASTTAEPAVESKEAQ